MATYLRKTMARTKRTSTASRERPSKILARLGGWAGGSIGQAEALAGVNVQSEAERKDLWGQFKHLFQGEPQAVVDAVMDHCAAITLERLKRGELSLLPNPLLQG